MATLGRKSMTRRETLLFGAASAFARGRETDQDPMTGASLYRDIVTYCSFGEHRTATEVDIKTSNWLAEQLRATGCDVRLIPFHMPQFFPRKIALTVEGRRINSFPLWWPRPTGPKPVTGPLVRVDPKAPGNLTGKIALVTFTDVPGASITPNNIVHQTIGPLQKAGVTAIVGVAVVPSGEIVELNAESGYEKWPVPILLAGGRDLPVLEAAAKRGSRTSVLLDGTYRENSEYYVVDGKINRGRKLIVISTPTSGWFRCAGERGPGIALWLALARWAVRQKNGISYQFVGTSAHELDSMGAQEFAKKYPPNLANVLCWLHLGANIATYGYKFTGAAPERLSTVSHARRLYSSRKFGAILTKAFADQPDLKPDFTDKPAGDSILMAQMGYPYFGFAGGSAFHHSPGDTPERATGPELLEPVGRDLVKALEAISIGS